MPTESQSAFFDATLAIARTNILYSNDAPDAARAALAATKATVAVDVWNSTQLAYGGEASLLMQLVGAMAVPPA